jgi:CHAT domain-containing protein
MPGAPIERELAGGEVHSYGIKLDAGQYLHVIVEQRGIDVVAEIFQPDNARLSEVNATRQGLERIFLVAERSGKYRLDIHAADKNAAPGRYEVKIEELRQATPQDRSRVGAEKIYAEAQQLYFQQTEESRRKAIEKFQESIPLRRAAGDRAGEAVALHRIGLALNQLGETKKSLESYLPALTLVRSVGDRTEEADILNDAGDSYYHLGDRQTALDYYNQALTIVRSIKDIRGEAKSLGNIALVYSILGDQQKALDYYNQSLPLRRAAHDVAGEALTISNIGTVYLSLGDPQTALAYYEQALPLRRAAGDRRREAITLNNIGTVYSQIGEYQKALAFNNQAMLLLQAAGDRSNEAVTRHNLGVVARALGDHRQALEHFQQALVLRRATGDRFGEAGTLTAIGAAYLSLDDRQNALDSYNQALPIRRAVGDRSGEASTLRGIGYLYQLSGENAKALEIDEQALQLARAVGDRRSEAAILADLGDATAALGNKQKARDYFNRALELQRLVTDRYGEAQTLLGLARAERDLAEFGSARDHVQAAIAIVESIRSKVASQELRASYLASNQDAYQFYVDLLMQMHGRQPSEGYAALALQISERARARGLLEILNEAHADINEGGETKLIERGRAIQVLLNAKAERLTRLLSGKHTEEEAAIAKSDLESRLTDYQDVQAEIRIKSPRYAALTQPQPLNFKKIQQQVLDGDTLLLEYSLGKERSYLWAVTQSSIASYELPKREEIEKTARRVHELLSGSNKIELGTQVKLASTELSQMILGPVAAQLTNQRLLIVADGALQYLPFAALPVPSVGDKGQGLGVRRTTQPPTPSPRPLMADHEIVSLPSASVLAVLRRELAGRQRAGKIVAVLADPVLQSDDPRVKLSTNSEPGTNGSIAPSDRPRGLKDDLTRSAGESGTSFERLRFTRQEADAIVALARGGDNLEAVDFDASKATAMSSTLGQYRIVHFAAHGLLNSQHPELSGVVLSLVDKQGQPQDGFMRLHDIYNLKLQADLVVLSACRTALGKEVRGEGLMGLTRGFMYAGAARVVASLWDVKDEATAELMKRFYEGMLKRGMKPAAALRAAQISMWKEPRWQAPYYWAAFVLQGEWR